MSELEPYESWEYDVHLVLRSGYGLVTDPECWPQLTFMKLYYRGLTPNDAVWMYLSGKL